MKLLAVDTVRLACQHRIMADDLFWDIIEAVRSRTGPDVTEDGPDFATELEDLFCDLDDTDIAVFDAELAARLREGARWDLRAACRVIHGASTEPALADFLGWLITQGQSTWEVALTDPDTIADVVEGAAPPLDAGQWLKFYSAERSGLTPATPLTGQPIDLESTNALRALFPRLTAWSSTSVGSADGRATRQVAGAPDADTWRRYFQLGDREQWALSTRIWTEGVTRPLPDPGQAAESVAQAATLLYADAGLGIPRIAWLDDPLAACRVVAGLTRGLAAHDLLPDLPAPPPQRRLRGLLRAPAGRQAVSTPSRYAIEDLRRSSARAWADVWATLEAQGQRKAADRLQDRHHGIRSSERLTPSPYDALKAWNWHTAEISAALGEDRHIIRSPLFDYRDDAEKLLQAVLFERVLGISSPVLKAWHALSEFATPAWPFDDILICTRPRAHAPAEAAGTTQAH